MFFTRIYAQFLQKNIQNLCRRPKIKQSLHKQNMQLSNIGSDSSIELLELLCKGRLHFLEFKWILFRLF